MYIYHIYRINLIALRDIDGSIMSRGIKAAMVICFALPRTIYASRHPNHKRDTIRFYGDNLFRRTLLLSR